MVHELISAANNSCNQTINVANISGRAISSALYICCIDQLILAFVQCKHNFLGFTILRILDYDPEIRTPRTPTLLYVFVLLLLYVFVLLLYVFMLLLYVLLLYVFVLLYVDVVMLHVFLEFGLGRDHTITYFAQNVTVNTFMHEFFRDAVRNYTNFSRICPKTHHFFAIFLKKIT